MVGAQGGVGGHGRAGWRWWALAARAGGRLGAWARARTGWQWWARARVAVVGVDRACRGRLEAWARAQGAGGVGRAHAGGRWWAWISKDNLQ